FGVDGRTIGREDIAAVDARLKELKYSGGWERLESLAGATPDSADVVAGRTSKTTRVSAALRAVAAAAAELHGLRAGNSASDQLASLLNFIAIHERVAAADAPGHDAHLRARAAVLGVLESLRDAHRA